MANTKSTAPGWRLLLLLLSAASLAGCSGLPDLRDLPFLAVLTPQPTPTPQIITIIATPTPWAAAAQEDADTVEVRRVAIYERVAPAVVNITTQALRSNFFWGATPEEGSGSGFLWDAAGHIVTNYHVIADAQDIAVSFGDDVSMAAQVVGSDPINDLAVLKVEAAPAGVQALEIGVSQGLKVGQTAIAIGNPFGQFERTMTEGIISAVNRTIETDSTVLRGVIQTDAAINRGNSGGPLLDSRGRLIGVNSAIYSPTGTSAGVGLAIPVDKVAQVVPVLIEQGRYPHPWLGIEELGYELSPNLARALRLPVESGLLIAQMYQGSPADQAGLRNATQQVVYGNRRYWIGGDVLLAIDGVPLASWRDLSGYLAEHTTVGQQVTLAVLRADEQLAVPVTLADTPQSLQGR